jgi:GH15 family glucan-1,4-alpha-glucosidase
MPPNLYKQSISIIKHNQHPSGAYLACPNFLPYRYSWFRDGAFIAYAMDLVGEYESANRFHEWATRTILHHEAKFHRCIDKTRRNTAPAETDYFHARFTPEGLEQEDGWGHHQLDGLGTWLWALCQHIKMSGASAILDSWQLAIDLVREYLTMLWQSPCYDCWEENRDRIHTYTLATLFAGLQEVASLLNQPATNDTANEIRSYILRNALHDGNLTKSIGITEVDANLIGVAVPFHMLSTDNNIMQQTVAKIENDLLSPSGGLHRYKQDTYYGGGAWVLLTAWLGWYYAESGQLDRARSILDWVEIQAAPHGDLPEQISKDLNSPSHYSIWVERWGDVASPLLWSHAKYLILHKVIQAKFNQAKKDKENL